MTIPADTHRQAPQRSYGTKYCCRCCKDRPSLGGRYVGLMFTCAECRKVLEKKQ